VPATANSLFRRPHLEPGLLKFNGFHREEGYLRSSAIRFMEIMGAIHPPSWKILAPLPGQAIHPPSWKILAPLPGHRHHYRGTTTGRGRAVCTATQTLVRANVAASTAVLPIAGGVGAGRATRASAGGYASTARRTTGRYRAGDAAIAAVTTQARHATYSTATRIRAAAARSGGDSLPRANRRPPTRRTQVFVRAYRDVNICSIAICLQKAGAHE
jgi:hypothetical protein